MDGVLPVTLVVHWIYRELNRQMNCFLLSLRPFLIKFQCHAEWLLVFGNVY